MNGSDYKDLGDGLVHTILLLVGLVLFFALTTLAGLIWLACLLLN